MKHRILRTAAAWVAAAVLFSVPADAEPSISAKSAVLLDGTTGRVLWENRAHERALIASTTKIMTGLLIAENCSLNTKVRIPKQAVGIEGSSLDLKTGEVLCVETLLYGMMLHSGNDAAAALALFHSGSIEAFAEAMNQRAKELGLAQTHYANPHGLDDDQNYSTAFDLAVLAACAMENPVFHRVVSSKNACLEGRSFTNHNKLLWQYDGAVGVKTGYTKSAGRILVSCAERCGRRLIAVTLSDPNDWKDHAALLDYGFAAYEEKRLVENGWSCAEVPVIGGAEETAEVVTASGFSYALRPDEQVHFRAALPQFVYGPVLAGDPAGELLILLEDKEIGRVPLIWRFSVMEDG